MLLTFLVVLAVAGLLFAAFIPQIRMHLFTWLDTAALSWKQGKYPYWWLAVSALLILPAVMTPLSAVGRAVRKAAQRRQPPTAKPLAVPPTGVGANAGNEVSQEETAKTSHIGV